MKDVYSAAPSNPSEFQRALESLRLFLLEFRASKAGLRVKTTSKLRRGSSLERSPVTQKGTTVAGEEEVDASNAPLMEGTEVRYRLEMANYVKAVGNVSPCAACAENVPHVYTGRAH